MTSMRHDRSKLIREALLESLYWSAVSPASAVAERFDITRQAVQLHLRKLTEEGVIKGRGKVRWRQYELVALAAHSRRFSLKPGFSEDFVWNQMRPRLAVGADG